MNDSIGVWFPTIQAGTGVDRFTERLVAGLRRRGIKAAISWLPHRAETLPWSVRVPEVPEWAKVVHVNSWLHKRFFPREMPLVVTLHSCVHDPRFNDYKSTAQKIYHDRWVYRREAEALLCADKVTAVSVYTADVASQMFGQDSIEVVPNWIDHDVFVPGASRSMRTPFRLLFVGNLSKRKGADLLPVIISRLGSGFELFYTGSANQLCAGAQCPDNSIPLGHLNSQAQLIKVYQDSDALILPTRMEGLPLVALEAASCGVPVIASDCTSLPEIVKDGVTGILCEQDNVDAFVVAAQKLKDVPNLHEKMQEQSRHRIVTHFSESQVIEKYIRIYEDVLFGRKKVSK